MVPAQRRRLLRRLLRPLRLGRHHRKRLRRRDARLGLRPPAATARIARPTPLQPYRPRLHRPLHQSPLRYDQPYSGVVAILFPADRGGADQGGAPRRTAGAADHRIGAQPDGRVAHGRRRFMAIHAFDRKTLRTGSQLAHRRTLRSRAGDPRRLPLPQRHVRRLRRLDAGDRLLQLRAGERQQGHRPFGRRQDLLGDLRLPAA